jgi:transcriptional regulator with XRE-family HTH domain
MSSDFPKRIPEKLKAIRDRFGLTPDEIARHVGARDGAAITAYENDEGELPVTVLWRYAKLAAIPIENIVYDERDLWLGHVTVEDLKSPSPDLDSELIKAEIAKTNLEITELQHPMRHLLKYIPVVTTFFAVVGLVITALQSHTARFDEMERNQKNQLLVARNQSLGEVQSLQSQIRADKEELLKFISDDKFSTATVIFLLDDLKGLLNQLSNREDVFGVPANVDLEREQIADLLQTIAWQLSFDQERHIDFDVQALLRWPRYQEFWIANGPSHHLLLSKKYYSAISNSYSNDRDCIEGLDFDHQRGIFTTTSANKHCETSIFPALVVGFKQHLEIMKKAGKVEFVRNELNQFAALTNRCKIAIRLEKEFAE